MRQRASSCSGDDAEDIDVNFDHSSSGLEIFAEYVGDRDNYDADTDLIIMVLAVVVILDSRFLILECQIADPLTRRLYKSMKEPAYEERQILDRQVVDAPSP